MKNVMILSRLFVMTLAAVFALPHYSGGEGIRGGDVSECNTVETFAADCGGPITCVGAWSKCRGCFTGLPGGTKNDKCVHGGRACEAISCTPRNYHALDDDCIAQQCSIP